MKKFLLSLTLFSLMSAGCKHEQQSNKIIDGVPLKVQETVIPAYALQELVLFTKDTIRTAVTLMNKTTIPNSNYSEVTNVSTNTYRFSYSNARYGQLNAYLQFYDASGSAIDPIANQTSSGTIKFMALSVVGASSLFNYSQSSALTLDTAGNSASTLRSTGTFSFTGIGAASGYTLSCEQSPAGSSRVSVDGYKDGSLTGTGSGPGGPITMNIGLGPDHAADGSLTWEGESGGIHLSNNGTGFVITKDARIPIE